MSLLSFLVPELKKPDKTEDPKIANALTAILAWANGNIDAANFAAAFKDGEAATECLRTLGTGSKQAAPGSTSLQTIATGLKLQVGSVGLGEQAGGYSTHFIKLPTAWATAHLAFIATGNAVNNAGFYVNAAAVENLAEGFVVINNNTNQDVSINWISIGY